MRRNKNMSRQEMINFIEGMKKAQGKGNIAYYR